MPEERQIDKIQAGLVKEDILDLALKTWIAEVTSDNLQHLFPGLLHLSLIHSLSYLPTPPLGQDMAQGQFLSGV